MRKTTYSCSCRAPSDRGPAPYAVQIPHTAVQNTAYRAALWTGCHLQMTLMSIPPQDDIGAEVHPDTDQYIRVEEGRGLVLIGDCQQRLEPGWNLAVGDGVFLPAGVWHNVVNTGDCPLKLSSVYAPPHHPRGTLNCGK